MLNPWYLRYYYATKMSNSIDDLDFNIEEFVNRTNSELVNNITNLISRTVGFLNKRLESRLGTLPEATRGLMNEVEAFVDRGKRRLRGASFQPGHTQYPLHFGHRQQLRPAKRPVDRGQDRPGPSEE